MILRNIRHKILRRYKMNFKNKTIIITGGSRGIGRGISQNFHDLGANVIICGRKPPEQIAKNIYFIELDIRNIGCRKETDRFRH